MNRAPKQWAVVCGAALHALVGWGCVAPSGDSRPSDSVATMPEALTDSHGREFLRADLWTQSELAEINVPSNADPNDRTMLANMLRAHMLSSTGDWYIEREPAYALADQILNGPAPQDTASFAPARREGRTILGTGDERTQVLSRTFWSDWMGFGEQGGTATLIGTSTAVTAAHVMYKNPMVTGPQPNGWFCQDGSTSTANPVCGSAGGIPQWRFGTGSGAWSTCWCQTIPGGWPTLNTTDWFQAAQLDYAVINFASNCATSCPSPNQGYGHIGTIILTDTQLQNYNGYLHGFAARAACPAGSDGTVGTPAGFPGDSDCPGAGFWPGNTTRWVGQNFQPFVKPLGTASLWGKNSGWTLPFRPGDTFGSDTVKTVGGFDTTKGQSGAAFWVVQTQAPPDYRLIGMFSSTNATTQRGRRWNSGLSSFVSANSQFPNDL